MMFVLGLNDFPLGVYSCKKKAEEARREHEARFFKWNREGPRFYWVREFKLNDMANL